MTSIIRQKKTLKQWKLTHIPFTATPPENPDILNAVFYGREKELDLAITTLYEGRNVLVKGVWGIGKTAFILHSLNQLKQQVEF